MLKQNFQLYTVTGEFVWYILCDNNDKIISEVKSGKCIYCNRYVPVDSLNSVHKSTLQLNN